MPAVVRTSKAGKSITGPLLQTKNGVDSVHSRENPEAEAAPATCSEAPCSWNLATERKMKGDNFMEMVQGQMAPEMNVDER